MAISKIEKKIELLYSTTKELHKKRFVTIDDLSGLVEEQLESYECARDEKLLDPFCYFSENLLGLTSGLHEALRSFIFRKDSGEKNVLCPYFMGSQLFFQFSISEVRSIREKLEEFNPQVSANHIFFQELKGKISNTLQLELVQYEKNPTESIYHPTAKIIISPTKNSENYHIMEVEFYLCDSCPTYHLSGSPLLSQPLDSFESAQKLSQMDLKEFESIALVKSCQDYPLENSVLPVVAKEYLDRLNKQKTDLSSFLGS